MTWGRATPALIVGALSDVLRYFFLSFWFFGPALAAIACTVGVNSAIGTTIDGTAGKIVAAGCTAVAGATGYFSAPALIAFGTVMAMAIGFLGWLMIVFIIFATDARVLGENPLTVLWLFEGLGASVVVMAWGIYRTQIKKDKASLKKYNESQAAGQVQERNQQIANLMQERSTQQAQDEGGQQAEDDFGEDALSELNEKQNSTQEENAKLNRARELMEGKEIYGSERNDHVLMAAYRRASRGQKVYDGTGENRNGFRFSNMRYLGTMVQ